MMESRAVARILFRPGKNRGPLYANILLEVKTGLRGRSFTDMFSLVLQILVSFVPNTLQRTFNIKYYIYY
jgi:hypothetical protein